MRDPKRIPRILKLIRGIWAKHPDLRLVQLIVNAIGAEDAYYFEDERLEKSLKDTFLPKKGG